MILLKLCIFLAGYCQVVNFDVFYGYIMKKTQLSVFTKNSLYLLHVGYQMECDTCGSILLVVIGKLVLHLFDFTKMILQAFSIDNIL